MYQGARSFCSGPPCLYKEELNRASVYRVIAYFTVTGRHRAQIVYFFRGQIGSRTPSGIGLGSGSRLRRMRPCLELPRELWIENFGGSWPIEIQRKGPWEMYITLESGGVGGIGD